jgi:hypothetical protein
MVDQPVAALFPEERRDAVNDIPAGAVRRLDEECDAFGSSCLHAMPASSKEIEAGTRQRAVGNPFMAHSLVARYPRDGRLGKAQNCRSLEESAQLAAWADQRRTAESVEATLLR